MTSNISGVFPLNIPEQSETSNRKLADLLQRSNSCELADILLSSLKRFAAQDLFDKLYIIVPTHQTEQIKEHMLKWTTPRIEIVDENKLIREFSNFPSVRGWVKQQLIKLGASNIVKTPFFITFDGDVVCTHPISEDNLLPGGKALRHISLKLSLVWKRWG